jgi:translation initiation factor IF-1
MPVLAKTSSKLRVQTRAGQTLKMANEMFAEKVENSKNSTGHIPGGLSHMYIQIAGSTTVTVN